MLAAFNVSKLLNDRIDALRAEANLTIEGSSKKRQQLVSQTLQAQRKLENLDYADEYPPIKQYLMLANICDLIVTSSFCNNWILICIILAGLLVGLQTYPQLETNVGVTIVDTIVLWSFTGELVLKIISEGKGPQFFFVGDEWKWNLFDFAIVMFSLPNVIPVDGSSVKLLRLVRLMRLAKVFRKIPQLQMIIMGLAGGLSSIIYIVILMLLCFYIFAIAGILFLKQNDPWHWRSIEICFMSLLRIATLDGWGDMFYISYYGCDIYDGGFYTSDPLEASDKVGGLQLCSSPMASPLFAIIFFLLFIILNAFCILSLFIGAVSSAMAVAMVQMKFDEEAARVEEEKQKVNEIAELYKDRTKLDRKTKRRILLMELAFTGQAIEDRKEIIEVNWSDPISYYKVIAYYSELFAENSYFQQFITFIIICAGVTVGASTDINVATAYEAELVLADQIILYVFVLEMVVKIIAEGVTPLKYFRDGWNCFDFIVVVGSFLPTGSGSLITILRLLRLLRVLKLMKALPQLQVIVVALMAGMSSVFFISVLLFMFFYFFAVIGVTFFSQNDVWHFGTLHLALAMLFQAATLDNWSSYLYINMYGCEQFGYIADTGFSKASDCTHSTPQITLAIIYWTIFILIGSLVLLSLFIGVVGMSMEDAKKTQDEDEKIFVKAEKVAVVEKLDRRTVLLYKEIFNTVDLTGSSRIGREEIRFGLKVAGIELNDRAFLEIWRRVDKDGSNAIDFSEFLEFMFDLRAQLVDPNSTLRKTRRKFELGQSTDAINVNQGESAKELDDVPGIDMEQSLDEPSIQSVNLTDMDGSLEEFPYKPDTRANLDSIAFTKPTILPPMTVSNTASSTAIGTIKSNQTVMTTIVESPQQDEDQVVKTVVKAKPITSNSNPFLTTPSSSMTAKNIIDYSNGIANKIKTYTGEYYQIQVMQDTANSNDDDVAYLMQQPQSNNKYGIGIPMNVMHAIQSMQQHGFLNAAVNPNMQQLQQLPFSPMASYNNPTANYGPTSFVPSKVKWAEMKDKSPKGNDVELTPGHSSASPKKPCKSLVVSI